MTDAHDHRGPHDERNHGTVTIAALVGAHAAVALTLSLVGHASHDFVALLLRGWLFPIVIGFFVSQLALIGAWAALGRTHWMLRCLAMLAVAMWVATLLAVMITEGEFSFVLRISVATSLLTALGLWLVRLYAGPATWIGEYSARPVRFQFSLLQLLLATALVAASVATFRFAGGLVHAYTRPGIFPLLALYFVIAAWPAVWLGMAAPRPWLWLIPVFVVACVGAVAALHLVLGWRFSDVWLIGAGMMSEAAFTYFSLCVVRWAGYAWPLTPAADESSRRGP